MLLLYYHPHPTGLTYYVKTLAEGLAARGLEVTVLAAQHTDEMACACCGCGRRFA